jgi:hypothetical protein
MDFLGLSPYYLYGFGPAALPYSFLAKIEKDKLRMAALSDTLKAAANFAAVFTFKDAPYWRKFARYHSP